MSRTVGVVAGLILLFTSIEAQGKTWIVPGVMNGPGANRAFFLTDITFVNPDSAARSVTLIPIGPPGSPVFDPIGLTLQPGETRLTSSPLRGPGALRITVEGGVTVFARISVAGVAATPPPPPTPSAPLPVIDEDKLLKSGEVGHAGWVAHSKNPSAGDRTNVAVVFPESAGGAATITLFDNRGVVLGSVNYDVVTKGRTAIESMVPPRGRNQRIGS
jgi:hypothetical protein